MAAKSASREFTFPSFALSRLSPSFPILSSCTFHITFFSPGSRPAALPPFSLADPSRLRGSLLAGSTRSPLASPSFATASTRTLSSRSSPSHSFFARSRQARRGARGQGRVVLTNLSSTDVLLPSNRITKKVCMGVHQGVTTVELDVSPLLPFSVRDAGRDVSSARQASMTGGLADASRVE